MINLAEAVKTEPKVTALIYCKAGDGKSTTLGLIAGKSKGKTLVLDVDRTFVNTMRKREIVGEEVFDKIDVMEVDNTNTFADWTRIITELPNIASQYENICVDNISELERCILSDLGRQGKNKGVPAQADYQYMQFKLVNSLRYMKQLGTNIYWTAWETVEQFTNPDGSQYSRKFPKISPKIVDNICGLCDMVANLHVTKDGERVLILDGTQNIYAKNQIDIRKFCKVDEF